MDSPFKTCHTVQLPADYIFNCVSGHCVAVFQETASQHEVVPPAPAPRLPGNLRNSGNGLVARKLRAFCACAHLGAKLPWCQCFSVLLKLWQSFSNLLKLWQSFSVLLKLWQSFMVLLKLWQNFSFLLKLWQESQIGTRCLP